MRHAVSHLALTGGMAAGDSLIQQVLGHGLAAKLSARLGEGVLNGLLDRPARARRHRGDPAAAVHGAAPPSLNDLADLAAPVRRGAAGGDEGGRVLTGAPC